MGREAGLGVGEAGRRQVVVRHALVAYGPVAHDDVTGVEAAAQRACRADPDEAAHADGGQRLHRGDGRRGADAEAADDADRAVGGVEEVQVEERGVASATGANGDTPDASTASSTVRWYSSTTLCGARWSAGSTPWSTQ